ncbi:MAG: hypothetical protein IKG93_07095 [Clostridiales bacterium]|nr:hypothetical protein [Clostridiales bacterium]
MFEKKKQPLTERERQVQIDLRQRCAVVGSRFNLLFWISIGSLIMSLASTIIIYLLKSMDALKWAQILGFVTSVLFAVVLFSLSKFNDNFQAAAIAYVFAQGCSFVQNMAGSSAGLSIVFSLASSLLSIAYVMKLTTGMEECFNVVDGYMADSWASFRKAFVVVMIITVACVILAFVPILNLLALIGSLGTVVAAIVLAIWQLVLLFRSAETMLRFSKSPVE